MDINYAAILVASIASFFVGFIWYTPGVFGNMWMEMSGITKGDVKSRQKGMAGKMAAAFVAQLVMAYVLWFFMSGMNMTEPMQGMRIAACMWLGGVATTMLGIVIWENKPCKLYLLNAVHWLVAMVVMGAVLGYMS